MTDDSSRPATVSSHLTLALTTLLHAFTHAYGTMLVPLYLLMRDDLRVDGVKWVAAIVTVYGCVYCLLSYASGILADRFNRKVLLAIGLAGNALAILLMGCTDNYAVLLGLGVMAGVFGSLFHPTANALIPAHYPKHLGVAIGLMGIGSGLGFFVGPQYAGWRANVVATAHGPARAWQTPCIEMGVAGLAFALIYLLLAKEAPHTGRKRGGTLPPAMRWRVLGIASILGLRDFTGVATTTIVGLYLMKAWNYNPQQAGLVIGAMMLISMVANPLAVIVSSGPRRLVMLASVLVIGGAMLAFVPQVPVRWLLGYLAVFQVFHLGSYAVGEASILERVAPQIRGRVIGLFLTLAGTAASTSPWIMGFWVDALGERARTAGAYMIPFAVLGGMMAVAAGAVVVIARLGEPEPSADVARAVDPSMEPI